MGRNPVWLVTKGEFFMRCKWNVLAVAAIFAIGLVGPAVLADKQSRKPAPTPDPQLPNVLILGDSISMGYMPPLQEALKGKANVVHPTEPRKGAMENCEGTTIGLKSIDRWLGTTKWTVIHFNWGLHDLKRVKTPGDSKASSDPHDPHQADVAQYEANLDKLVTRLEHSGARLVFATTTPVPKDLSSKGGAYRDPDDVAKYNEAARRVMKKHGVAVDDLFAFCLPRLNKLQQPRNVHFTATGSRELAKEVAAAIEEQLKPAK
jgi:hypothetical protein